ncbi:MAG: MFS transporter, partial [Kiritimatiellae bacterium]|nr:MFS transporter [Kiritimatiellia bacterium]
MSNSGQENKPEASLRSYLRRIMLAWFIGAGWAALASGAVFYRFAERMGLNRAPFIWGLLSAVPFLATFFQVFGSLLAERTGRYKAIFLAGLFTQRLIWFGFALLPYLFLRNPTASIVSVLVLFFLQSVGGNIGTPPFLSWMAEIVPARIRARYFAFRHRLAMVTYVTVSLISGWLLNAAASSGGTLRLPWPGGPTSWTWHEIPFRIGVLDLCSIFFAIAAILGTVDILFFVNMSEPARLPERVGLRQILLEPWKNSRFVRFLTFYAVFLVGCPGTVYYIWRNVTEHLGVSDLGAQMMLVVLPVLGEMLFAPVWGHLLARFGRKPVWRISLLYVVILPLGWLFVLPKYWWLGIVITTLGNISWNGADQGVLNWLLELSGGERGSSSYQAVFALVTAVAGTLSGLLLGFMASVAASWDFQLGPFR